MVLGQQLQFHSVTRRAAPRAPLHSKAGSRPLASERSERDRCEPPARAVHLTLSERSQGRANEASEVCDRETIGRFGRLLASGRKAERAKRSRFATARRSIDSRAC